jgi:hypothetical protein
MKRFIAAATLLIFPMFIFSQDIAGLWKGTMYNDVTKQSLPYELLIKKEKGKYTGFSYTRFIVAGEECYGVKKVKVSIAKDGKIVILDNGILKNTYPILDKKIKQLNVLDIVTQDNETSLDGPFVTNITKQFMEVTGHINVKRTSSSSESQLVQYLQKENTGIDVAVVK